MSAEKPESVAAFVSSAANVPKSDEIAVPPPAGVAVTTTRPDASTTVADTVYVPSPLRVSVVAPSVGSPVSSVARTSVNCVPTQNSSTRAPYPPRGPLKPMHVGKDVSVKTSTSAFVPEPAICAHGSVVE